MKLVEELIPEIIGFQTCSINPSGSDGGGVVSRTGSGEKEDLQLHLPLATTGLLGFFSSDFVC